MSNDRSPPINPWFIAVTVTLATFMELLDTSIANVALPYIGGGLGRSYDEVTWILTTYLVANAVILPMSAWLSRVFGRKTYYLGCVALFTLTSLLLRIGAHARDHAFQPRAARARGRRLGAGVAGDPGRHVPSREARVGIRSLHDRDCDSPGHRARCWAAGSRTTTVGAGYSSSIFRSASCRSSSAAGCSRIRLRLKRSELRCEPTAS